MATLDPFTIEQGDRIEFRSICQKDNNLYSGKVVSFGQYSFMRVMPYDIVPYYREVIKTTDVGSIEDLHFFILEMSDDDGVTVYHKAFALEYIETSSLKINTAEQTRYLKITSVSVDDLNNYITLIKQHGHNCIEYTPD